MIKRTSKKYIDNLLQNNTTWNILDIGCGYNANKFAKVICDVQDLSNHYQRDTERQFLGDTIKELIKLAKVELPDDFMKRWLMESNEGKITQEQLDSQYDNYAQTFKWQLLEGELLKEHKEAMEVKDDEVRAKVAGYFQAMGGASEMNPQIDGIIDQVLSNPEEKQKIFNDIQDEKLIKLFKENISSKKKSVTKDKFIEIASKID